MPIAVPLYRSEAVRRIDQAAIASGIPALELMTRAAAAAFATLRRHWPYASRIVVACGSGNNGGDGWVLARLAREAGLAVEVVALRPGPPTATPAIQAFEGAIAAGVSHHEFDAAAGLPPADAIIDALFGIGLRRAPGARESALISAINAHQAPVLSLDVPSGLDADLGEAPGVCIHAARTVSFIARKIGVHVGSGRALAGSVEMAELGVPATAAAGIEPAAELLQAISTDDFPARSILAHKGHFGHVLVVGGDLGYGGALRLCAEAALRCGAGLVSAITRSAHVDALLAARPECMVRGVDDDTLPVDIWSRATVLAVGPGLGLGEWGRSWFERAMADPRCAILDADALNLLARLPRKLNGRILTPHPGEAARLLGVGTASVQADRAAAATQIAERFDATVVLKGAGSLVAAPAQRLLVIDAGNPGLATGGSGDVLTGVIAALLAQGFEAHAAASLGALLHAQAADAIAVDGIRGMLPSDLFPALRRLVNPQGPSEVPAPEPVVPAKAEIASQ